MILREKKSNILKSKYNSPTAVFLNSPGLNKGTNIYYFGGKTSFGKLLVVQVVLVCCINDLRGTNDG